MPTWGEILLEVKTNSPDAVRRKYLIELFQHTGRNVILYATKFTQSPEGVSSSLLSIVDEDLQGLMQVVHGLPRTELDLILHSPGGSLEAAEAIVTYLRSKFTHIRVVVPHLAQSAATMIACAADAVVMGKHSFLGPIDPQVLIRTQFGQTFVPAQAITEQFQRAVIECQDPKKLAAWAPMLSQYGPHLLSVCDNVSEMSETLVADWLSKYMLKGRGQKRKAGEIAKWLANHKHFKTHSRHIPREELVARGLVVEELEADQTFQDLVLSVFHATTITFDVTAAVKIIENQLGKAFLKVQQQVLIPMQGAPALQPPMKKQVDEKKADADGQEIDDANSVEQKGSSSESG